MRSQVKNEMFCFRKIYEPCEGENDLKNTLECIRNALYNSILSKCSENCYIITEKRKKGLTYNSFSPEILIILDKEKILIEYKLKKSVAMVCKTILCVEILLGIVMAFLDVLVMLSFLVFCLILFCAFYFGFFVSCKIIEKKIRKVITNGKNQSGGGYLID